MNRILTSALVLAMTALPSYAQDFGFSTRDQAEKPSNLGVTSGQTMTDTVNMVVGGDVNFIWVNRDAALNQVRGSLLGDSTPASESVIHGHTQLFFNFTLADNVKVHVNVETKRLASGTNPDVLGSDSGTQNIDLRNTTITINELFDPALSIVAGSPRWVAGDFAGNGTSGFFDPGHNGSITNSFGAFNDVVALPGDLAASRDELLPAGWVLTYGRQAIHLDVAMFTIISTLNASPANVHSPSETAYLAQLMYDLPGEQLKGSKVGGLLCLVDMPNSSSKMMTIGGGAGINGLTPGLELNGSIYLNSGEAADVGGTSIKAKGMAFDAAAIYRIVNDAQPYVGAKIVVLSGDNNNTDTSFKNFLGYRTPGDTAIVESDFYGLGYNENLTKIQFSGGAKLNMGQGKNNLEVQALLALMSASKKLTTPTGTDKALGTELDLKAIYSIGKQVHLNLLLAFLFGSDILDDAGGAPGNQLADDASILFSFGIDAQL